MATETYLESTVLERVTSSGSHQHLTERERKREGERGREKDGERKRERGRGTEKEGEVAGVAALYGPVMVQRTRSPCAAREQMQAPCGQWLDVA